MRPLPRTAPCPHEFASAGPLPDLAEVLEPDGAELASRHPLATRRRPCVDFAFADTVFADDLQDEEAPPPATLRRLDTATRLRVHAARLRHALWQARDEMRELWGATAVIVDDSCADRARLLPRGVRRFGALWSCFQWSRVDLVRAALIGLAVFITTAALGTSAVDPGSTAARGDEVRARRTLDQHTGSTLMRRTKR
jgi:hypothetical protein